LSKFSKLTIHLLQDLTTWGLWGVSKTVHPIQRSGF